MTGDALIVFTLRLLYPLGVLVVALSWMVIISVGARLR